DIDWQPVNPDLKNKVLLPLLEDQYGRVLEAGKIRLEVADGTFTLRHYQTALPVAPRTYPTVLERALATLTQVPDVPPAHLRELQSILTALRHLPPRTDLRPEMVAERQREMEVVKQRLAALCGNSLDVRSAIDAVAQAFNGTVGEPRSF